MGESERNSWGREKRSLFERHLETLVSCGAITSTTPYPNKTELNALFSAMRDRSYHRSLSDKLTQSLISAGLVRGITPRSVRKQLGAQILDIASLSPVGGNAE